jgi:hypothetical protein
VLLGLRRDLVATGAAELGRATSACAFSSAVVISVIEALIAASFALTSALSALPCSAESLVALNSANAVWIEATSAAGSVLASARGAAATERGMAASADAPRRAAWIFFMMVLPMS